MIGVRASKRYLAAAVVLGATLLAGVWLYHLLFAPTRTSLPLFVRTLATRDAVVTLVTIYPAAHRGATATRSGSTLRGWPVIGAAKVSEWPVAYRLIASLDGKYSRPSDWPACFEPRHGLIIRRGPAWAEMIICFECAQTYSAYGIGPLVLGQVHVVMSPDANAFYNAVAREHGLSLAE